MTYYVSDLITELVGLTKKSRDDDYNLEVSKAIAVLIPRETRNQLVQLTKKPVWDGDLISKSDRDYLVGVGLAAKIINLDAGNGYQSAVFPANEVVKFYYEDSEHRFLVRE